MPIGRSKMLLAGVGSGGFGSFEEASRIAREANRTRRIDPDPGKKELCDELFSIYKEIHPRAKSISHSLTRLGRDVKQKGECAPPAPRRLSFSFR